MNVSNLVVFQVKVLHVCVYCFLLINNSLQIDYITGYLYFYYKFLKLHFSALSITSSPTVRAEIFAVVLFSRISRVKPSRKFPLQFMSIYSNDNISKSAKLTPRELPHLAKTAKITVRENNGVYSNCYQCPVGTKNVGDFCIHANLIRWLYTPVLTNKVSLYFVDMVSVCFLSFDLCFVLIKTEWIKYIYKLIHEKRFHCFIELWAKICSLKYRIAFPLLPPNPPPPLCEMGPRSNETANTLLISHYWSTNHLKIF